MEDIKKLKEQLRRQLKNRLLEMEPEKRAEKSRKACKNLIATPQFRKASVVMMYLALPNEVDTADAFLAAWQEGKTVAVPKVSWQQRHMIPVKINTLETGLATNTWGLRNPTTAAPVAYEDIDLVIVPGLGFDKNGNRLGRGSSYYDRFLAHDQLRAFRCGFAFNNQVVDSVPVAQYDAPMDALVTDQEVVNFNSNSD